MLGSFLSRASLLVFGYAYPAYECFKTVEKNKPEVEQLQSWCKYWVLIAMFTAFEKVGDSIISWLPFYGEAKLVLVIYLWSSNMKGTKYVYQSFFKPFMAKHEVKIDGYIWEFKTKAVDIAIFYWQKTAILGRARILENMQSFSSQPHNSIQVPLDNHDSSTWSLSQQQHEQQNESKSKTMGVSGEEAKAEASNQPVNIIMPTVLPLPPSKVENVNLSYKKFRKKKESSPLRRKQWKMFWSSADP